MALAWSIALGARQQLDGGCRRPFTEHAADWPPLLYCRMLEVTTLGMEKRLGLDFAQVYKQSNLAK